MSCWAIVAINTRPRRKRRLRGELDPVGRDALARRMLAHVLGAADGARAVERVVIVSPSRAGLPTGYEVIEDVGQGLSAAFEVAREAARAAGARELVLLPADLPHVVAADVEALIDAGRRAKIAIAPDRGGTGTNGLYLPAALDFPCRFGVRSRVRHEAGARRRGIEPAIVTRDGLAADLDTPADLRLLGPGVAVRPALVAGSEQGA